VPTVSAAGLVQGLTGLPLGYCSLPQAVTDSLHCPSSPLGAQTFGRAVGLDVYAVGCDGRAVRRIPARVDDGSVEFSFDTMQGSGPHVLVTTEEVALPQVERDACR